MFLLKSVSQNSAYIVVTLDTFQRLISSLKLVTIKKSFSMLSTPEVSHELIGPYSALQLTGSLRHKATASRIVSLSIMYPRSCAILAYNVHPKTPSLLPLMPPTVGSGSGLGSGARHCGQFGCACACACQVSRH